MSTGSRVVSSRTTLASGSSKSSAPRFMRRARSMARQLVGDAQALDQRVRVRLALGLGRQAERASHAAVGELRPRAHHAADEAARDDVPCASSSTSTHRQRRSTSGSSEHRLRRQRARQHRDRAIGQVDAAAARLRLVVDRRAGRDVRAHVGDGDPRAIPAAVACARPTPRRRDRARPRDRWSAAGCGASPRGPPSWARGPRRRRPGPRRSPVRCAPARCPRARGSSRPRPTSSPGRPSTISMRALGVLARASPASA